MVINQEIKDRYAVYNADCMEVLPTLKKESIGLSVYSPPFPELYNYSSSPRDMSNCASKEQFFDQYEFIVKEISRITKTGRMSCVHCMDMKGPDGSQWDFPGEIIRLHEKHGFRYAHRYIVWKEPLRVAIRTRLLHLTHKQIVKDSTRCGCAGADYVIAFRKIGENKEPVAHPEGLTHYAGETIPAELFTDGILDQMAKLMDRIPECVKHILKYANLEDRYKGWKDPKTNKLSHWIFQQYASSVWMDIRPGNVMPFRPARESEEEKHVCPLQLDIIERCIQLYSNPNDIVFTPFLGVGSEVYTAVKNGRIGIGVELKESYYKQALRNIQHAEINTDQPDLFNQTEQISGEME